MWKVLSDPYLQVTMGCLQNREACAQIQDPSMIRTWGSPSSIDQIQWCKQWLMSNTIIHQWNIKIKQVLSAVGDAAISLAWPIWKERSHWQSNLTLLTLWLTISSSESNRHKRHQIKPKNGFEQKFIVRIVGLKPRIKSLFWLIYKLYISTLL